MSCDLSCKRLQGNSLFSSTSTLRFYDSDLEHTWFISLLDSVDSLPCFGCLHGVCNPYGRWRSLGIPGFWIVVFGAIAGFGLSKFTEATSNPEH